MHDKCIHDIFQKSFVCYYESIYIIVLSIKEEIFIKAILDQGWELAGFHQGFWEFSRSMEIGTEIRGITDWLPAAVPGSIHKDLHRADVLPNPYYDLNSLQCEWVNERDWLYRLSFQPEPDWKGKRIRLACEGIDYSAKIRLNGVPLGEYTGMFHAHVVDITDSIRFDGENQLLISIAASPEGVAQLGYTNRVNHLKSRFGYKWDFCPRLIHIGLWKPVYLWITDSSWIENCHIRTTLEKHGRNAKIRVATAVESDKGHTWRLRYAIYSPQGELAAERTEELQTYPGSIVREAEFTLEAPQLWWPNGYGAQSLYRMVVQLWDEAHGEAPTDEWTGTFGIRSIRYVQNEGSPADSLPYTIVVNDTPVYLKGWNWVPTDQLYGDSDPGKYDELIRKAKAANVNLLRVWGGGLVEREYFYDLCDQAGIMIWQEMLQSSSGFNNEPSVAPEFLHLLGTTIRSVIREKRNHPSLAIWCGGNELTEGGHLGDRLIPLSGLHPTLRLLGELVQTHDPDRLFVPTSSYGPSFFLEKSLGGKNRMYDVHGPWKYAGPTAHYELYNESDALLHSEFGGDGFCNIESMRRFLPEERIGLGQTSSRSWLHHGYEYWSMHDQLHDLFGPIDRFERLVALSQWLQAEGIRYALEANRRRAPQCSGSILWQFNEPFPNISCTSAIDYYGDTKLAYHWIARAYAKWNLSLKYDSLVVMPGSKQQADLYLAADGNHDITQSSVRWTWAVRNSRGDAIASGEGDCEVACLPLTVLLHQFEWEVPTGEAVTVADLTLYDRQGSKLAENRYLFVLAEASVDRLLQPILSLPDTSIQITPYRDSTSGMHRIELENTGKVVGLWVRLKGEAEDGTWLRPLEDGFLLFPGEKKTVLVEREYRLVGKWSAEGVNID